MLAPSINYYVGIFGEGNGSAMGWAALFGAARHLLELLKSKHEPF
jgi:hypothetical protein